MTPEEFSLRIAGVTSPLPGSIPQPSLYRFSAKKKHEGWLLPDFLCDAYPRIPREKWIDKIEKSQLTVNGKDASINLVVKAGYRVEHYTEPKLEPEVNAAIKLIYEDDDILVVDKPAPLPMHPCGRFNRNSLIPILNAALPGNNFKVIHRIDANTTGVVVVGKHKKGARSVMIQFEEKQVSKQYLALIEGIIEDDYFTSDQAIGKDTIFSGARTVCNDGHEAYTEFSVLERYDDLNQTLLQVTPHTGRTNQIRLHLSHLGFPIVGDNVYEKPEDHHGKPMTHDSDALHLHAWKLTITLPSTGERTTFVAQIPEKYPLKENVFH